MAKKPLLLFTAEFIFLVAMFQTVTAKVYYVNKNHPQASNNNPGTQTQPWLTIQHAAEAAAAGDTVFITKGVYNELVTVKNSGAPGKYITFKGYSGDTVVLDGSGYDNLLGIFNIYGKDYIKLEDIEIKNNKAGFGVLIQHDDSLNYASYIELSGLDVHHTGGEVIEMRGNVSHVLIKNCVARHGLPYEEKVWIGFNVQGWRGGRPHHITITGCTAYDFDYEAKYGGVGGGIANERGDYITVTNNIVYNAKQGIDIGSGDKNVVANNIVHDCRAGIAISSNEDSEIYNNIIYNIYDEAFYNYYWSGHGEDHARNKYYNNVIYNAGFGIYESNQQGSRGGIGPTSDHQYFNNLFYNIGTHGSYRTSFYFKETKNLKFYNNTIYMNDDHDAIELLDGANYADIRNNIISISGSASLIIIDSLSVSGSVVDYNCYHKRSGSATGPGSHSINSDPNFVSVADSDFHLQSDSPCIDSGVDLSTHFTTDKDSISRPQETGWDMGAYEYIQK